MLSGVTRAIVFNMQEFLNHHPKSEQIPEEEVMLHQNDQFNFEIITHYEFLKNSCSVRTINVLNDLEISAPYGKSINSKINFINNYLFQPYDFLTIRNSGNKTVDEIFSLIKKLKEFYHQSNNEDPGIKVESKELQTDPISNLEVHGDSTNIDFLTIFEYEILKLKCSARTINILNALEKLEGFNLSVESKILFIEKIFLSSFNYNSLRNCGVKTVDDLKNIQHELRNFLGPRNLSHNTEVSEVSQNNLEKFLSKTINIKDLDGLRINENFSLQRVFYVLISELKLSTKVGAVLRSFMLIDEILNVNQIAELAECSLETVRNSIREISNRIVPNIVETLQPYREFFILEKVSSDKSHSFLEVGLVGSFTFHGKEFVVNSRLETYLLAEYLKHDFLCLNNISNLLNEESQVFDCGQRIFFLKTEIAQKSRFVELLQFLEHEIYAFESVLFEYNLKVLIHRFFQEHEILIDGTLIDLLHTIVTKIKRDIIQIDSKKIKKINREQSKDNIKIIVEDFLKNTNQAQKTKTLISELLSHNVAIQVSQLIFLLNSWSSTFARVGHGAWVLKEWLNTESIKGSVREIAEKLILEAERPLHVSEILTYFETFRPISERSLFSNLRVSENIHFQFFNCSFIGLKSKNYDASWSRIPKFSPTKFRVIWLKNSLLFEEKISALEKFGYPRIHCEYALHRRQEE